nr:putative beta-lactamase-like 1 [Anolis sagrei ordinatus]
MAWGSQATPALFLYPPAYLQCRTELHCPRWPFRPISEATKGGVANRVKGAETFRGSRTPHGNCNSCSARMKFLTPLLPYLLQVDMLLRHKIRSPGLPALSAIVIYNDTVLWTGNFGKRNGSDPSSGIPNEYTIYRRRRAGVPKLRPAGRIWPPEGCGEGEEVAGEAALGLLRPLPPWAQPALLPSGRGHELRASAEQSQAEQQPRPGHDAPPEPLPVRAGTPRASMQGWGDNTNILCFLSFSRCHYSNLAFSLMAHVLAEHAAEGEYQRWVSENILDRLGMEDTGFDITPPIRSQMAVGFYGSGQPAPLYDLGWYRPSGQMYSTAADLAKLAMVFLGTYHRRLLEPDTVKTMLTPLFKCSSEYFANKTGTPWEINEQLGYDIIRKDGDLDGYSATFSLVPKLRLSFIVLMAGPRPQGGDVVAQTYEQLIPAMESAFREAEKSLAPPPSPAPYVGYYTYSNLTFYEIKVGAGGVLVMQQFGPHIEELIPANYRTIKLHHLEDRVFQVVFDKEFPCTLHLGSASVSLETQDGQLFNFYPFDRKGLSPGFDAPGLNTYNVLRIHRKPVFYS